MSAPGTGDTISVALGLSDGKVARVAIRSTRLTSAARHFAGKKPEDVARLLPMVLSLCGHAQREAALAAMEAALGIRPSAAQLAARRLISLAEAVADQGLCILRDWPAMAGEPAELAEARALKLAMHGVAKALYPDGDQYRIGGGTLHPDRRALRRALFEAEGIVAGAIFGMPPDQALSGLGTFLSWTSRRHAPACRLMGEVIGSGQAEFGRSAFIPMPASGPSDLAARLAGDGDGAYCAAPDSQGRVFETGPLARHSCHPIVESLLARWGNGLAARLAARLVALHSALREMHALMQDLTEEEEAPSPALDGSGSGTGVVEAARGLLAHRVEIDNGMLTRYQILAPTEWNFHADGPLARSLAGAAAQDIERRAALLVAALDPCVACTITVEA